MSTSVTKGVVTKTIGLVCLLTTLLSAGCGGGGGGSSAPPAPTTYSITGKVVSANNEALPGTTVTATLAGVSVSQVTDRTGSYTISGLGNGSYVVAVTDSVYNLSADAFVQPTFATPSSTVTINNSGASANFNATSVSTFTFSGKVTSASVPLTSITMTLDILKQSTGLAATESGGHFSAQVDASGNYSVNGLPNADYKLTIMQGATPLDEKKPLRVSADTSGNDIDVKPVGSGGVTFAF